MPITTKVVSLNPVRGEVYSIHHYVIKFVSDLLQVADRWFSLSTPASPTNKTDRHGITEILLTVALNTINQSNQPTTYNVIFILYDVCFPYLGKTRRRGHRCIIIYLQTLGILVERVCSYSQVYWNRSIFIATFDQLRLIGISFNSAVERWLTIREIKSDGGNCIFRR